jgi:NAD(P)-dependent dehydrogenase (short-subunit alcohol dehydrogenase family)
MSYLDQRADVAGRVAVIIGGGGGVGRACAEDLGRAGMRLALCDRDTGALDETAAAIAAAGAEVLIAPHDAREPEALAALFAAVDDRFGACDVLINVVGGTYKQPFTESVPKGWDALIRTNFTWLLHATQLAVARMGAAGGSIINITSIEAHRAAPGFAVYAAMKAAVTSFTRTLAVELGPQNIRVNAIAPDYIATPSLSYLTEGMKDEAVSLQHRIATPMGRVGTFEDAGGCALFLASNLSSFVTGATLHPDGGAIASSGWFNWPDDGYLNHPPRRVLRDLLAGAESTGAEASDPD